MLGSLIELSGGDLVDPTRIARLDQSIAALVEKMRGAEPERAEGALAARGMADAAAILARHFTLQATNPPFLGRARQTPPLADYLKNRFNDARADLATGIVSRMRALAAQRGTVASVTPQNWLFLGRYERMRTTLLAQASFGVIGALGTRCFGTISGEVVNAALITFTEAGPEASTVFAGYDANEAPDPDRKAEILKNTDALLLNQFDQAKNPDSRIIISFPDASRTRLNEFAECYQGLRTGDRDRFVLLYWETDTHLPTWAPLRNSSSGKDFDGIVEIVRWGDGRSDLHAYAAETRDKLHDMHESGNRAWGRRGVALNQMKGLKASIYSGERYDGNVSVIFPKDPGNLLPIVAFCVDETYSQAVTRLDKKLAVTNATLLKVPFDLAHWQKIAAEKYPTGLPEPYSDDPTQWLFHGHPRYAETGTEVHVALARLAGYRWPAESDAAMRPLSAEARARIAEAATLPEADADGLLPLDAALGERPLADRLRSWCAAAWGDDWRPDSEARLIAAACERADDKPPKQLTFEAWLRGPAARQHAKLFHDRPFLWWIGDGRADGFTGVAHYHRLDRGNLERLTYSMLGDWIARLGDDPRAEAAKILQHKLALILEGEKPYDIFVRWKPLARQPDGWDPDLDDGVRLNIRPFVEAKVLAYVPNVKYDRPDRGKDVPSAPWHHLFHGERRNDHHTTLAEKRAARAAAAEAVGGQDCDPTPKSARSDAIAGSLPD